MTTIDTEGDGGWKDYIESVKNHPNINIIDYKNEPEEE